MKNWKKGLFKINVSIFQLNKSEEAFSLTNKLKQIS